MNKFVKLGQKECLIRWNWWVSHREAPRLLVAILYTRFLVHMRNFAAITLLLFISPNCLADKPLKIGIWPGSEKFRPIIEMIYKGLNIKIQFVNLPTERVLMEVSNGQIDADIARSELVLGMYPNIISSNESFTPFSLVGYVANRQSPVVVQKIEDIKKYHVGLIIGTKIAEDFVKRNGVSATRVYSVEQLITLMANGRIDIALMATIQDVEALEKIGMSRLPMNFIETRMVHILNKEHMIIRDKFDQEVRRLNKSSSKFRELLQAIKPK